MSEDSISHSNFDFRGFSVSHASDNAFETAAMEHTENIEHTEHTEHIEHAERKEQKKNKHDHLAGKTSKSEKKSGKKAKNSKNKEKNKEKKKDKKKAVKGDSAVKPADSAVAGTAGTSAKMPLLFTPMTLRGLTIRNRVWLPPMDMYSAYVRDGKPTPFHYQHYVSRALGGFGMIIAEATAVSPEGRISPKDVGLWNDDQIDAWRWIVDDVKNTGAVMAVQLNHAGRKAAGGCFGIGYEGESVPFDEGGWLTVAPSAKAYTRYTTPHELTANEIHGIVSQFADAARRAVAAGFQAIEIHGAHGYLISQFLDPLVNEREDEYGGDFQGRIRFLIDVVDAVRGTIPEQMPLLVRISATDWAAGGWDLDQTVMVSRIMRSHGVDLVDVSTGGVVPGVTIPVKPGYQVPFSAQVRSRAEVPTTAVGLITKAKQAERILRNGEADAVEIGRAALRDPSWPMRAAHKLGVASTDMPYPDQYVRGAY